MKVCHSRKGLGDMKKAEYLTPVVTIFDRVGNIDSAAMKWYMIF
jgi:dihydrodipicolinate synthase/N-acetylneuraminate lyase